ncbi:MAG: formylglycine-generating enzyme family protein, partial [Pirellula sp.]
MNRRLLGYGLSASCLAGIFTTADCGFVLGQETKATSDDKTLVIPESVASTQEQMKPYAELVEHSPAKIEMIPIPGGTFRMGSPDGQEGRKADEGPVHEVKISPFWMAKCEITWDAYD